MFMKSPSGFKLNPKNITTMPAHIKEPLPTAAVIVYMASFPVWNPDLDRIEANRLEDCERLEKNISFHGLFCRFTWR